MLSSEKRHDYAVRARTADDGEQALDDPRTDSAALPSGMHTMDKAASSRALAHAGWVKQKQTPYGSFAKKTR